MYTSLPPVPAEFVKKISHFPARFQSKFLSEKNNPKKMGHPKKMDTSIYTIE